MDLTPFKNNLSVLVFRLGNKRFALPTACIKEITNLKKVHRIPHRSGEILKGIVNINGVLQLCIDLHPLLKTERVTFHSRDIHLLERMIAIIKESDLWIFPVEGVEGIFNLHEEEVKKLPKTAPFIKGIVESEIHFNLLDEEALFQTLKRDWS